MTSPEQSLPIILGGLSILLLILATIKHFSKHSIFPAESWILMAGLLYGITLHFLPGLPVFELTPDLVILLLLPTLIFASARTISPKDVFANGFPIAFLAIVGVVLTVFLIGVPLAFVTHLPLADALLLGAAVAATDPSAVAAIFKRFDVPEKLAALIEGESLFNDATAIVVFFTLASITVGMQEFSFGNTIQDFLWSLFVAIPLGAGLGFIAASIIKFWGEQNQYPGISITLALVYGSFIIAEHVLHVSGVITVMAAAWVFVAVRGQQRDAGDTENPELFVSFWDYLNQLATGILFFVLGVTTGRHEFEASWAIPGIILLLLFSRCIVVYGSGLLFAMLRHPIPLSWQHTLTLGGLRGAVSAALVLMIPASYEYRESILCLVLVLCLYTLLVHPLLLRKFLSKHAL